jgi:4-amino-4-deoxy-L-arabinose transferase-like glycosyltransferase
VTTKIDKRDLPWVGLIIFSFLLGLAASWERWGNPLVDCGREMNQPLRLLRGEMLYSDVRHIYGPLSPYANAALYRLFGVSLDALYADGILTAIIILALVYSISRRLMGRAASAIATLEVMWLCAFKQAGNYIFPYSYSALHGCALGLATLALILKAAEKSEVGNQSERDDDKQLSDDRRPTALYFLCAGVTAGLTMLAKTEMGLAAVVTGLVVAWLGGQPRLRRSISMAAAFLLPALALIVGGYSLIASRVGWDTLSRDSFLFFQNLPQELVYYNKRMSGFDMPMESLGLVVSSAVRLAGLAGIVVTLSILAARWRTAQAKPSLAKETVTDAGQAKTSLVWAMLVISTAVFILAPAGGSMSWDKGPYLAMPVLLAGLLIAGLFRYQKQADDKVRTLALIAVAVFALASLARVLLRVRSGGAYSSYLLPASVILFTYFWVYPFPDMIKGERTRRFARNFMIVFMLAHAIITGALLSYRYRARNTHPIETERGRMIAPSDIGIAINEAVAFINRETSPGDAVAVMPEGTSINFFTDRANPLREEITTPGFLDEAGEERAIRQIRESNTRLVLVTNRATSEFGPSVLGRDYNRRLMQWVEENYEQAAIFGPSHDSDLEIGDRVFFIRAYRKK